MATVTDVEVANASFPTVRQDLNDILEALATNFSADAEPSTMYANQFWYETDTNLLKMRNEANDAWITLAYLDQTAGEWEPRTAVIQAIDGAGLSFKTDEGTTRVTIADSGAVTINTSLDIDNIKIDGNSITSTDTNGNINITPNGTGKVVLDGLSYPTADGTDGQVLTTDGAGNIAFEDAGGAGKVLQVVQAVYTTASNTGANVYNDTGLNASITPSSTSSKVLVMVNQPLSISTDTADVRDIAFNIVRGSTIITDGFGEVDTDTSTRFKSSSGNYLIFLDSPNTTSSTTYKTQFKVSGSACDVYAQQHGTESTITLMEIAG